MAEILYNNAGVPLVGFGKSFVLDTVGGPLQKPKSTSEPKTIDPVTISVDDTDYVSWGSGNNFPDVALGKIGRIGVLNTGLKYIRNFTLGQGIYPVKVEGYDDKGNEVLSPVSDQGLKRFCQGRMVRQYMAKVARDYFKIGAGFVQLLPNEDGSQMTGISTVNAQYSRLSKANNGIVEKCIVSGAFPSQPSKGEYSVYDVLDDYDPLDDLIRRRYAKKIKGKSFIYVIRDSWSNNEYYSEPIWQSADLAGWLDIASKVPAYLRKAYENQITWKWHVQIPYAFWDRKFPKEDFETTSLRKAAIDNYMDTIEENLCGTENADKPIFTFYEINPVNQKAEEKWIIEPLDNKTKEGDKLITSAAANSEILFSLMINPNVMGAGMPGGTYAGNQGGSNIREAFLVNIANAWLDRQAFLDPLEAYIRFNGVADDIELRFQNTILTTLDTGAGTAKTLS